jgi:hypothetical protein
MARPRKTIDVPEKRALFARTNRRKLDTVGRITSEMAKIYRAASSGTLPTDDAMRLSAILRELRVSREAADAAAVIDMPTGSYGPVNILSIPSGCFIDPVTGKLLSPDEAPVVRTPTKPYAPTPPYDLMRITADQAARSPDAMDEPLPVIGEITDDHRDDDRVVPLRPHARRDDDEGSIGGA